MSDDPKIPLGPPPSAYLSPQGSQLVDMRDKSRALYRAMSDYRITHAVGQPAIERVERMQRDIASIVSELSAILEESKENGEPR